MKIKNHISFFLALLMVTKLFAFDGQLLRLVADPGDLVVVKHSCKMENFLTSTSETRDFQESPSGIQVDYGSFCNSFFQFEVPESFKTLHFTPFHEFSSPVLHLHSAEREVTSPPPKVSV